MKAFFCLSGFLMTMLMDTAYRGRPMDFAINRFLRLYPIYWVTMATTAVILLAGVPSASTFLAIPSPPTLALNARYINDPNDPQLLPTSWAVTNEIVFYALIALGISKTLWRTAVWLAVSILYVTAVPELSPKDSFQYHYYFSPLAASLPFAVGATAYHLRDGFPRRWAAHIGLATAFVMTGGPVLLWTYLLGGIATMVFLLGTAFLTLSLFYSRHQKNCVRGTTASGRLVIRCTSTISRSLAWLSRFGHRRV